MFARISLVAASRGLSPRFHAIALHNVAPFATSPLTAIAAAAAATFRFASSSSPLSDLDRSHAGHLASRESRPHFRPRSDRDPRASQPQTFHPRSSGFGHDGRRDGQVRKQQSAEPLSDFTSFKSPFGYTEPPELKWDQVPLARSLSRALSEEFKYESCTPVQAAIASKMPLEHDVVVQAKTGTGKTLAFLVPAINRAITAGVDPAGRSTKVLIVSPTRELALQIGAEATRLVSKARLGVHTLVGGESKLRQVRDLTRRRCDIVIGTPGRLLDMIQSEPKFRDRLKGVESFILDEADRMLEIGFKEDIEAISKVLPDTRHTMLFSATYPSNVDALVKSTLQPGFEVINTISDDDVSTVHAISQSSIVAPLNDHPLLLYSTLARAMTASTRSEPFKAIVFFPTTRSVELYTELFHNVSAFAQTTSIQPHHIHELHSRKNQAQRVRIADKFRKAHSGILFTSDVSARGVDYPGINLVVQMGIPTSRDQYVHRIGRTGRAGKVGSALSILAPFEKAFMSSLGELPIKDAKLDPKTGAIVTGFGDEVPWDAEAAKTALSQAASDLSEEMLNDAFLGNLGFYQGQIDVLRDSGFSGYQAMKDMYAFYEPMGLSRMPNLPESLRGSYRPPRDSHSSGSRSSSSYNRSSSGGFRSSSSRGDRDSFRRNDRDRDGFRGGDRDGGFRNGDRGGFRRNDRDSGDRDFGRHRESGNRFGDKPWEVRGKARFSHRD
ncbi:P-loop containing nucleoside triphosphate hydrolase protein [Catenaria anguillulae PL171]|uniref:ATP-dependent RNA helicase n=1 Tax=Catenaria anguillulae PL171 TaxID=765915 RepID=A0A1Y2HS38_9FUNG|nr:P-loop containing nucleoside triphosphate hydrolase protein [Catenaria anguillulae PL171]